MKTKKKKRIVDLKSGITEDKTHRRCQQIQCSFYVQGGCKPCEKCSSDPFILNKDCETCYDCENVPGELRWDDPKIKAEAQDIIEKNGEMEELLKQLRQQTPMPPPPKKIEICGRDER